MCVCVCVTVQLRVQFSQVWGDGGDQDLDSGVGRTDLKACLIGQHGQHWRKQSHSVIVSVHHQQAASALYLQRGPGCGGSPPPCCPEQQRPPLPGEKSRVLVSAVSQQVSLWRQSAASLTGGQDLQDDHQVSHIVSGGHGALLVGAHLTHLLDLLPGDRGETAAGVTASRLIHCYCC